MAETGEMASERSIDRRDPVQNVFMSMTDMFSGLDSEDFASSQWESYEVDELYNQLVANFRIRNYFNSALSGIGSSEIEEGVSAWRQEPVEGSPNYILIGKPRFENIQAKKLYAAALRAVRAREVILLFLRNISENRREKIEEVLSNAPRNREKSATKPVE